MRARARTVNRLRYRRKSSVAACSSPARYSARSCTEGTSIKIDKKRANYWPVGRAELHKAGGGSPTPIHYTDSTSEDLKSWRMSLLNRVLGANTRTASLSALWAPFTKA